MKIRLGLCVVGMSLVLGCGSDGAIEEFVKLDNSKGEAFAAGGEDCAAKAKVVGEWRKKNTKRYDEIRDSLKDKYKEGPPEKYKADLTKNKKAVRSAMMACSNDPAFGAMMDETSK